MYDFSILNKYLKHFNISLNDNQIDQFNKYYDLLIEWNSFMNLTAITDFEEVIIKHFVDSMAIGNFIDLNNKSVIDIGTGAGFPGLPIKILFPESEVVLMDSLNKRINFLNAVIDNLDLKLVRTVHSRAEDLGHNPDFRETFDYCTSRAVANLSTLTEYCIPFVKVGGVFISYKSEKTDIEVNNAKNAFSLLNCSIDNIYEYKLPDTDFSRTLVLIKKNNATKKKYPRKAGTPSKEPL